MSEQNSFSKQTVNNQLFTASVTGATYDDFSQNAILFPVLDLNTSSNSQGNIQNSILQNNDQLQSPPNVNSFIAGLPNPAGLSNESQAGPPPKGQTSNLYRRSTNKKVTYAQIPGLISSQTVKDVPTYAQPPPPTTTGSIQNQSLNNYFQPISNQNTFSGNVQPPPSSILQPENNVTIESSTTIPNVFTPPLPTTKIPQTSALLTPAYSSSFISESGISSGARNISSPVDEFGYGNEMPSSPTSTLGVSQIYRPVYQHWFHKRICEGRTLWEPFSMLDSLALEMAFNSADLSPDTVLPTNGGRYDVNILRRERYPVYWNHGPTEVRRCSWFSKGNTEGRFVPYEENIATILEEEYRTAFETNTWNRTISLPNGDSVVFHGPDVIAILPPGSVMDPWGNSTQMQPKVRTIKRGMDEFDIDEGEPTKIDHLIFVVHGIGSVCDLKFRTVQEVVDEFRTIALQLVQSHYRTSCETNTTNRIEILPISWHGSLHSEGTGIDQKLKNITLESLPRLRDFTNTTLLDILFYTSPVYCQTITSAVTNDLNRIHSLFLKRNPDFQGGVSLVGHSLGSLILFDILSHQQSKAKTESIKTEGEDAFNLNESIKDLSLEKKAHTSSEIVSCDSKVMYSNLNFNPTALFALGSPLGMFITVRGTDKLGPDFTLPTCSSFYNIFHPYDPVAYRIESLINSDLATVKPVLIPHHKGRKRMHLELKETMYRVSSDLKQKVFDSMKYTWNTLYQMANRALEQQMSKNEEISDDAPPLIVEEEKIDINLGSLNGGHRIDYVLQEAPFEIFNEYVFAVTSHLCYWESEDTVLFILKEIYSKMGIVADGSQAIVSN